MRKWLAGFVLGLAAFLVQPAATQAQNAEVPPAEAPQPPFGIEARRPIMGGACPTCVWGPFAEVTKRVMVNYGYDIQICWSCNAHASPLYVADARIPHDLKPGAVGFGGPPPPKGPVDFGVTNERAAQWLYHGTNDYSDERPRKNLRLIAHFEDPAFLVVAVKDGTGITDLAEIAAEKLPVRIHIGNPKDGLIAPILEYYGITPEKLESWGGRFVSRMEARTQGVDVLINRSASNANNSESAIWNWATWNERWHFLTLPQDLRDRLVNEMGYEHVTLPVGYFPGVTQAIPTVERSGQVVIARDDTPEEFAYTLAKAMDEQRLKYLWSIRPFFADPRRVWKAGDLPLHPGAERYYREVGYIR